MNRDSGAMLSPKILDSKIIEGSVEATGGDDEEPKKMSDQGDV